MLSKYAIKKQSIVASPIIYIIVMVLAFIGIWARLYIEFITPDASDILGSSTPAVPHLPLSLWPANISLTISLSLFSTVYGLASEPFSKVDYSDFHLKIQKLLIFWGEIKHSHLDTNQITLNVEYITDAHKFTGEAIASLEKELSNEKGNYSEFVKVSILAPLKNLEAFLTIKDVCDSPELILELFRSDEEINYDWIRKSLYPMSYRTLIDLFDGD
jgi:hypothetical protein